MNYKQHLQELLHHTANNDEWEAVPNMETHQQFQYYNGWNTDYYTEDSGLGPTWWQCFTSLKNLQTWTTDLHFEIIIQRPPQNGAMRWSPLKIHKGIPKHTETEQSGNSAVDSCYAHMLRFVSKAPIPHTFHYLWPIYKVDKLTIN